MKKFELTAEQKINRFGRTIYRIKACISFTTTTGAEIAMGDLGGWVEKEQNLSHDGKAWVWGNVEICGDAKVWGNAEICGNAKVWGNAKIWGNVEICGDAKVWGNVEIWGNAEICGNAKVWGNAEICGDAMVWGNAKIWGNAEICGNAKVWGNAEICGNAKVWGNAFLSSPDHIFNVTPVGEDANSLTLFRTKSREICISFGWDLYSLEGFIAHIQNWSEKMKKVALAAIEIAKLHIDLDDQVELKPCPFCGEDAEIVDLDNGNFGATCNECNCNIGQFTEKKDAAKAWNTRTDE